MFPYDTDARSCPGIKPLHIPLQTRDFAPPTLAVTVQHRTFRRWTSELYCTHTVTFPFLSDKPQDNEPKAKHSASEYTIFRLKKKKVTLKIRKA
jgi:hypothetical protein